MKTHLHEQIASMKATSGVTPGEGELLADFSNNVPDHGIIVEVGSCQGRSTAYLASGIRHKSKVLIFSIDLWLLGAGRTPERHHDVGGYLRFQTNLRMLGLFDRVIPVMSESTKVAKVWTLPIDLLFIDGGHKYEEVSADIKGWARFVKPKGFIAFHDYNHDEVKKAVDEFLSDHSDDWKYLGLRERIWYARRKE